MSVRVVLLANYVLDAQPSMQRFADLLAMGLAAHDVTVDVVRAAAVVGRGYTAGSGLPKYLGYVDKYVLFPRDLREMVKRIDGRRTVVHVCDHSNAAYTRYLAGVAHLVTCHDLIAVRAARAEFTETRTRWTGRVLQRTIVRGLRRAGRIVCDSDATRDDVERIVGVSRDQLTVISPGLSPTFRPVPRDEAVAILRQLRERLAIAEPFEGTSRFLLHVGGGQWYKNRRGVIEIYAAFAAERTNPPPLVMVGKPLDNGPKEEIARRGLAGRVVSVPDASDRELAALYSAAILLMFPSLIEGFGWPIVEAMSCGCRVVVSNRAPLTEVARTAASYIDPANTRAAAAVVAAVVDEPSAFRHERVADGLHQAGRFSVHAMVAGYAEAYRQLLDRRPLGVPSS